MGSRKKKVVAPCPLGVNKRKMIKEDCVWWQGSHRRCGRALNIRTRTINLTLAQTACLDYSSRTNLARERSGAGRTRWRSCSCAKYITLGECREVREEKGSVWAWGAGSRGTVQDKAGWTWKFGSMDTCARSATRKCKHGRWDLQREWIRESD